MSRRKNHTKKSESGIKARAKQRARQKEFTRFLGRLFWQAALEGNIRSEDTTKETQDANETSAQKEPKARAKHLLRINGQVREVECEIASSFQDRNGKEIFEGDEVRFDDGDIDTVIFDNGEFRLIKSGFFLDVWHSQLEIIGHAKD